MKKTVHIDQWSLTKAITDELYRQHPEFPVDERMNIVFTATKSIVDGYAQTLSPLPFNPAFEAWLAGDDTGSGSRFMAHILSEPKPVSVPGDFPADADELGRCIRLLDVVPELAVNLDRLNKCGPNWQVVVINWEQWKTLYKKGLFTELQQEMRDAYRCISVPR